MSARRSRGCPASRTDRHARRSGAWIDGIGGAAEAVIAVAAGNEIADQIARRAVVGEADARPFGVEVVHRDVRHVEPQRRARGLVRVDQIAHDLVLAVNRDPAAAGQRGKVDAVARRRRTRGRCRRAACLPGGAVPKAHRGHQIHRALLEHAGADPLDDVFGGLPFSRITESMPWRRSRCPSMSPDGPPPTMPTCVRAGVDAVAMRSCEVTVLRKTGGAQAMATG